MPSNSATDPTGIVSADVEHQPGTAAQVSTGSIRLENVLYPIALVVAVLSWLTPIGSPLWLDETNSFWEISGGFSQIWSRQGLAFPAYNYILWFTSHLFGSNEAILRIPSVLAMLAAVWLLYRCARELFDHDLALVAAIIFSANPIVTFAAIDARSYAFGALTINAALLALLRWTRTNTLGNAAWFGAAAGAICYFHYLFVVILAAFVLVFTLWIDWRQWRTLRSQLLVSAAVFSVVMLPVISRLHYMVQTRQSHVFSSAPTPWELVRTFAPGATLIFFTIAQLWACVAGKISAPQGRARGPLVCVFLGIIPLGILYVVSTTTTLHIFVERYRLVALPGIALCWAVLLSRISSTAIRAAFCAAVVTAAALTQMTTTTHGYSWKGALQTAETATTTDHAPVLICSDLPEANYLPLPADARASGLFSPLSYYKLSSPVVPLPRALNPTAVSQVERFLKTAAPARQRFLVLGFVRSYATVQWIADTTRESYRANDLGTYDGVAVFEFVPR